MKVLTIHNSEGNAADFCWGIEGEIAVTPIVCDTPNCGCDRSHAGISSGRASTTLMVREVDLDDDLAVTVRDSVQAASDYPTSTVLRPLFDRDRQCWRYEVTT